VTSAAIDAPGRASATQIPTVTRNGRTRPS
jgi:hypothetical protein